MKQVRFALRHLAASALFALGLSAPAASHALPMIWNLSEFQPNIAAGGRANSITVNPTNNAEMFVASETGGVFHSTDQGATWSHVDSLPLYSMGAIAFVPSNPSILIATGGDGFGVPNQGGIWRSADGGTTWTQVPNPPAPAGISDRFSAGAISIAPDTGKIFVATSFGISFSSDNGVTWTTAQPFGAQRVASVLALPGDLILAGGGQGVKRSVDGGATWIWPSTGPGGIADMNAFGRSPLVAGHAYVVNAATSLFVTEDSGVTWQQISSAPGGGGSCGGIAFIKATRIFYPHQSARIALRFGNRCGLYRLVPPRIGNSNRFDYSGSWQQATLDHGDTRDLAFSTASKVPYPLLLATDGGLHKTADGGQTWTFTGGGSAGYNALQITEVKGQWIDDIGRYDLFFGTQDNDVLASTDNGVTWPTSRRWEGFFIEALKRVATTADSQVTAVLCGACGNWRFGAGLSAQTGWSNPSGNAGSNPVVIGKNFHVQGVDAAPFDEGLARTFDLGTTWTQYARFPEDRRDLPKLSRTAAGLKGPVQYQSIRVGWDATRNFEIDHLVRISRRPKLGTGQVSYPAMQGFGGFGINPTMFAWYQVFAVDPNDSRNLLAPDIINEKMMQSRDGGASWSDVPALTALVTDSGKYQFRSGQFPHAGAVSYNWKSGNVIGVGTHQNGVLLSTDGGATWSKVRGSSRATYITSIDWRSATQGYVSTYGRGLWRLTGFFWLPRIDIICQTIPCRFFPDFRVDPPPYEKFTPGVVVFDGRILGVRSDAGRVTELFVSPGSSIGLLSRQEPRPPKFKITETTKAVGVIGRAGAIRSLPKDPVIAVAISDDQLAGLVSSKEVVPVSLAFGPQEVAVATRPADNEEEAPDEKSPRADRSYIRLSGPRGGVTDITPGSRINLRGDRLPPGMEIEVLMDKKEVTRLAVDGRGSFSTTLVAPPEFGLHSVEVRAVVEKRVIDGTSFLVSHGDEDEKPARGTKKEQDKR